MSAAQLVAAQCGRFVGARGAGGGEELGPGPEAFEECFPAHVAETLVGFLADLNFQAGPVQLDAAKEFTTFGVGPYGDAAKAQFDCLVYVEVTSAFCCHMLRFVMYPRESRS